MCIKCVNILLPASETDDWEISKLEWEHVKTVDVGMYSGSHCICSHPIRYECHIINSENGNEYILGSHCILNYRLFTVTMVEEVKESFKTHCKYCKKTVSNIEQHKLSVKHILNKDEWELKRTFIKCEICKEYRIKRPSDFKICYVCNRQHYRKCIKCHKQNVKAKSNYKMCFKCNKNK